MHRRRLRVGAAIPGGPLWFHALSQQTCARQCSHQCSPRQPMAQLRPGLLAQQAHRCRPLASPLCIMSTLNATHSPNKSTAHAYPSRNPNCTHRCLPTLQFCCPCPTLTWTSTLTDPVLLTHTDCRHVGAHGGSGGAHAAAEVQRAAHPGARAKRKGTKRKERAA